MADQQSKKEDLLLSWSFFEFEEYKRGKAWYIAGGLIALFLIVSALLMTNFLFAMIIILVCIILLLQIQKQPRRLNFSIAKDGIKIENKFYSYQDLKSFWIIYRPPEIKKLYIQNKRKFSFLILIPLEDQDPNKVREVLLKYLDEEKDKEESFAEKLSRQLKF